MENLINGSRHMCPGLLGVGGDPSEWTLATSPALARVIFMQGPQLYGFTPPRPPLPSATPTPDSCTSLMCYLHYYLILEVGVHYLLLYIMGF